MGGSTDVNSLPEDGDNVVAVSYTIALGPLVWGLIIGAIHAVVSYNGPSELVRNSLHYFLTRETTNLASARSAALAPDGGQGGSVPPSSPDGVGTPI